MWQLILYWECFHQFKLNYTSDLKWIKDWTSLSSLTIFSSIWNITHRCALKFINHASVLLKQLLEILKRRECESTHAEEGGPCSSYLLLWHIRLFSFSARKAHAFQRGNTVFIFSSHNPDLQCQCLKQITVYIRNLV